MTDSLIEHVHASASTVVGMTTRTDLGQIRDLDLARYEVAVSGSIQGDVGGHAAPLYLSSVLAWSAGPNEFDLLPDGNAPDPFAGFDVAGLRLMAGGQQLTFHRDLVPQNEVVLEVTLASADLKETKSGRLLVLVVDRRYTDVEGPLLECRETFLGREGLA